MISLRLFPLLVGFGASLGLWRIYRSTAERDALRAVLGGLITLAGALLGGRAGYILLHGSYYAGHPDQVARFWQGGLNAYGALAGGVFFAALGALLLRRGVSATLDHMSLLLMPLGAAAWLGLWAEGVAYGSVPEPGSFGWLLSPDAAGVMQSRFPLQLVAALSLVVILYLVERLTRGRKPGYRFALSGFFFSLHLAVLTWFRADPVPVWRGIRSDLLFALALAASFALIGGFVRAAGPKLDKIGGGGVSPDNDIPLIRATQEENMIDLTVDTDLVRSKLTTFIREEVAKARYTRLVVGLSGGLDSTLACYLAVDALGAENVLGVRMPYRTSSAESMEHAQLVIDALGIPSLTIPITDMVEPLFTRFPEMDELRKGNIMARERMIVLFDQSAAFKGLVLGTGNKTEYLLGYTTLYGDSANALNPLGDLYKIQVRQLSRALGVPKVIITKPPSADLWVGQTDEGELGFTYADVDQVLHLLVDQRVSPEECVEKGFAREFVRAVIDRVRKSQFKRVLPPIAKLDASENNYDFLNLSEWGG